MGCPKQRGTTIPDLWKLIQTPMHKMGRGTFTKPIKSWGRCVEVAGKWCWKVWIRIVDFQ
jgi:hypothetical protein